MFLSFWTIFYPFTPWQPKKAKIIKKEETNWRYYYFTHVYHKWKSPWTVWRTEFLVILDCFFPFYPPNNPKNQNLEKLKKYGDVIILHKCTKNHYHMLYCPLDMGCNGFNCYFSFCTIFLSFYFPNNPMNLAEMRKIPGDIIILQWSSKNHDHMLYCSWNMMHDRCNYF